MQLFIPQLQNFLQLKHLWPFVIRTVGYNSSVLLLLDNIYDCEPRDAHITRDQKHTMLESGHEVLYYQEDFKRLPKEGSPIVLCHNGNNHLCPTVMITIDQHSKWKLEILIQLCRTSLQVMGEIDRDKHSDNQKVYLTVLEEDLSRSMMLFPTTSKAIPAPRPIPIFTNIPIHDAVKSTSGEQVLPSASSDVASQSVRREGKIRVCQLCGESKRKSLTWITTWP